MNDILLVDMGNSRIKWAWASGADTEPAQAAYAEQTTTELLDHIWSGLERPAQLWLSCVNGQDQALVAWARTHWDIGVNIAQVPSEAGGLYNGYHDPERLGVDRWLAMVAAHTRYPGLAICVVDLGTAVTVDMVDASGQHLGGYILPGLSLMRDSLGVRTGLLAVEGAESRLGQDTGTAITLGTRIAVLGLIERAVVEHQQATGDNPIILLTGGDADEIRAGMHLPYEQCPGLVLEGLAQVAKQGKEDPCAGL